MADPLRIGVVGVGALALRGILPHLAERDVADRVQIAALCDPVTARAESAATRFRVPRAYSDLDSMIAAGGLDAVTIASPIGMHYAHCVQALSAGLHVHVNKTLCTTVEEADELIMLADRKALRLVPSPGEILRPQITRAREMIRSGVIGEVSWALCGGAFDTYHEADEPERQPDGTSPAINPAWYFRKPGGGPLYDITVYSLHQLTSILGPAQRVTALSGIRIPARQFMDEPIPTEADDNTILLIDFGSGLFAVAHGTAAGAVSAQFGACVFYGTKGTIDGVLLNGEPFEFPGDEVTRDAPAGDWDAQMRVLPHVVGRHWEIPEAHVFEDIMQLVHLVRDDRPTAVSADQARHVIDIIESGYRAAATGSTQDLRTGFDLDGLVG